MLKVKSTPVKMFEAGQKVVLLGATKYDREIFVFKDPIDFVAQLRKTENKNHETNAEFMKFISDSMSEDHINVPFHNEEVFVKTLIKIGICVPAVLN
jgi:hypothetical protein